jgi:hypothetical protein
MFYRFFLYLVQTPVYPLYGVGQQAVLGAIMFAPSPLFLFGFIYVSLVKETRSLDSLERRSSVPFPEITPGLGCGVAKGNKLHDTFISVLSLVMISMLLLFSYVDPLAVASNLSPAEGTNLRVNNSTIVYIGNSTSFF